MYISYEWKLKTGKVLNSDAIIADANCTKTCFYLSFILLASSGVYELFEITWFDIAGSVGNLQRHYHKCLPIFYHNSSETFVAVMFLPDHYYSFLFLSK
jgi:hypothetical protein